MKLKTTRDPKSGVISVQFGTHKINTGTTSRTEAKRLVTLAAQLTPHIFQFQLAANPPIGEAIQEWDIYLQSGSEASTAHNYLTQIKAWAEHQAVWKSTPAQITDKEVDDWVNAQDGTKMTTRQARRSILRSFFGFCLSKKFCLNDPTALVRVKVALLSHRQKERTEKKVFKLTDIKILIDYLDQRISAHMAVVAVLPPKSPRGQAISKKLNTARFWRAAVAIGYYCGLRLGDICQLEWACFERPGQMIVWTDKRDARVVLRLKDWPGVSEAAALIPCDHKIHCFPVERVIATNPKLRSRLSMQFERICAAARLSGYSFHCLRHAFVCNAADRGQPIPHIAKVVGHSSTKTTAGYLHVIEKESERINSFL